VYWHFDVKSPPPPPPRHLPCGCLLGVLLSLSVQLTNYLQVPPHSEGPTQAIRARQELQSRLGVYSTALLCTSACLV
jgi:hypothetical protein